MLSEIYVPASGYGAVNVTGINSEGSQTSFSEVNDEASSEIADVTAVWEKCYAEEPDCNRVCAYGTIATACLISGGGFATACTGIFFKKIGCTAISTGLSIFLGCGLCSIAGCATLYRVS